jgi:hypothetical protein
MVGGLLQVRSGGPSDCRAGQRSELSGLVPMPCCGMIGIGDERGLARAWLGDAGQASAGSAYVPPAALATRYASGSSAPSTADVDPPDYSSTSTSSETSGGMVLVAGVAAAAALSMWLRDRSPSSDGMSGCPDLARAERLEMAKARRRGRARGSR